MGKRCFWRNIPQKIFTRNFNFCHFGPILKFRGKFFFGIFLQKHSFPTKSRPRNHVVWFILTSNHHKMPKQEQRGSKTPKMPIFDGFCLLTRKLIFFLQVLKLFLESASPIRPLKVYFEVFPTPKQSEPGWVDFTTACTPVLQSLNFHGLRFWSLKTE